MRAPQVSNNRSTVGSIFTLLVTLLVGHVFSGEAVAAVRADEPADPEIRALRSEIATLAEQHGTPGVGVALVENGDVTWAGGVGFAEVNTARPVDAQTHFRVGSITKTVLALTVMRLHEQGVLSLDARVADLAPELPIDNPWRAEHPITVAHLLEHTAGFDDMRFNETHGPVEVESMPLLDVLRLNPRSRIARWQPGSRHAYSNPGYTVVGYLIEKVTGMPYEAVVEREVLRPLGMTQAGLRRTPELARKLAQGYSPGGAPIPYWATYHRPAGHLMASPAELAQVVRLFLASGQTDHGVLLPRRAIERMERSETRAGPLTDIAYGLGTYGEPGFRTMRGHNGGLPGFLSDMRWMPRRNAGYVLLLNAIDAPGYIAIKGAILRFLTRRNPATPAATPPAPEPRAEDVERWLGHYEFSSPRHQIFGFVDRLLLAAELRREDDGLRLDLPGLDASLALRPLGGGRFALGTMAGALVTLRDTEEGQPALLLADLHYERTHPLRIKARRAGLKWARNLLALNLLVGLLWVPGWLRRGRFGHTGRLLGPGLLCSLLFFAWPLLFYVGLTHDALGDLNPLSAALFFGSWVFPWLATIALFRAIREAQAPWPLATRAWALAIGVSSFGIGLFAMWEQLVGLRTWLW